MKIHLRKIRQKIAEIIFDKQRKKSTLPIEKPDPKILLVRHDGKFGDLIVSFFIFEAIKQQYPSSEIHLVTVDSLRDVCRKNKNIDNIHIIERKRFLSFLACGLKLRFLCFDAMIDLSDEVKPNRLALMRLVKAKDTIGLNSSLKLINNNLSHHGSIKEAYIKALSLLGCTQIKSNCTLPDAPNSVAKLEYFRHSHGINQYIAVNFYGAGKTRQISEKNAEILLKNLINTWPSLAIVIVGAPMHDIKIQQLIKKLALNNVYHLNPTATIFDNFEVVRNAEFVISPDTSIVHIAAEFNKPIIAFYSNDNINYERWKPSCLCEPYIIRYANDINDYDFSSLKNHLEHYRESNKASAVNNS